MFGNGFEHPAHETGGSPVDHDDAPAGAADAHQLGCHTFGARRKHGAHQADDNISGNWSTWCNTLAINRELFTG